MWAYFKLGDFFLNRIYSRCTLLLPLPDFIHAEYLLFIHRACPERSEEVKFSLNAYMVSISPNKNEDKNIRSIDRHWSPC